MVKINNFPPERGFTPIIVVYTLVFFRFKFLSFRKSSRPVLGWKIIIFHVFVASYIGGRDNAPIEIVLCPGCSRQYVCLPKIAKICFLFQFFFHFSKEWSEPYSLGDCRIEYLPEIMVHNAVQDKIDAEIDSLKKICGQHEVPVNSMVLRFR